MTRSPWILVTLTTLWFLAAVLLGAAGFFQSSPGGYGLPLLGAVLLPVAVYLIQRRFFGGDRSRGLLSLGLATLVGLQAWRVGGFFFLVEWWRGHLPAGFALPAGIGDLLVGLAAPLVAVRIATQAAGWRRSFLWWNVLGLLDLVVAVSAGVTHAQTPLGIFADGPGMDLVASYPLNVIPTFGVPLSIILHLAAFARARSTARVGASAPTPERLVARLSG